MWFFWAARELFLRSGVSDQVNMYLRIVVFLILH